MVAQQMYGIEQESVNCGRSSMSDSAADEPLPRTALQLIFDREFGSVFWGKCSNLIANWAFTVITVMEAFNLTGSPAWSGAVSAAQMAPLLLLTLLSGRLCDSLGERWLIVAGGWLSGLPCIALAVCFGLVSNDRTSALVALLICTFVSGCGMALSAPAFQSIVMRLARPTEVSTAVSLGFFPAAAARALGPALGAVLLVAVGPAMSFLCLGLVLALTAAALHMARLPALVLDAGSDTRLSPALHYVFRDRVIMACLLGAATVGAASEPVITLAPTLAASFGHQDASGLILSAFGGGGAFGIFAHRLARMWLSPLTEGVLSMGVLAGLIAVMVWAGRFEILLVVTAVAGCAMVMSVTSISVVLQQRCHPVMLGRVMAMWVLAFAGVRPFAALILGNLAVLLELHVALLAWSVLVAGWGVVVIMMARSSQKGERC